MTDALIRKRAVISAHIKQNSAEGYIWFLLLLFTLMLAFGGILNIVDTTVEMKNIKAEVTTAAEDVFADIRKNSYDQLSSGATDHSTVTLSKLDALKMFSSALRTELSYEGLNPVLSKNNEKGTSAYRISNFDLRYISRINGNENTYTGDDLIHFTGEEYGYESDTVLLGDVNRDGKLSEADTELAQAFVDGKNPTYEKPVGSEMVVIAVSTADVDVDEDGVTTSKDVALIKAFVSFYEYQMAHSDTGTAMLMISFDLEVPLQIGTFSYATHEKSYSFTTTINFLPNITG